MSAEIWHFLQAPRGSSVTGQRNTLRSSALPALLMCVGCLVVSDSVTPWTIPSQAPLSMEFSRQEYWSGLPFPSPGDLPDSGIETESPAFPVLGRWIFFFFFKITESLGKPLSHKVFMQLHITCTFRLHMYNDGENKDLFLG